MLRYVATLELYIQRFRNTTAEHSEVGGHLPHTELRDEGCSYMQRLRKPTLACDGCYRCGHRYVHIPDAVPGTVESLYAVLLELDFPVRRCRQSRGASIDVLWHAIQHSKFWWPLKGILLLPGWAAIVLHTLQARACTNGIAWEAFVLLFKRACGNVCIVW